MEEPTQVKVYFKTSHAEYELPEDKRFVVVPASFRRTDLSKLVVSEDMLAPPKPMAFDFRINGYFLRGRLGPHLQGRGLSAEEAVTLEYMPCLPPTKYKSTLFHDEWVCDADVLSVDSPAVAASAGHAEGAHFDVAKERCLTACYDRIVRVWDRAGDQTKPLAVSPAAENGGHTKRLNTARWISPSKIASAGLGGTVLVWDYSESSAGAAQTGSLKPNFELVGHKAQIHHISVHHASKRMLTASDDGRVGLWSTSRRASPAVAADADPDRKTVKRAKKTKKYPQRGPLAMIPVSDMPVTDVMFHPQDASVAYAASMDGAMRTVDLTTQKTVSTIKTLHPLRCLGGLTNSPLLAAGTTAKHITLMDPRVSADTTSVLTLRGHRNWVSSVAPNPGNDYSLVSGSWDSTCKVWDLRSTRAGTAEEGGGRVCDDAVYTVLRQWMKGHKPRPDDNNAKVLRVRWDKSWGIVSCGEDQQAQIDQVRLLE